MEKKNMENPCRYIKDFEDGRLRRIIYKFEHCEGRCETCPCKTSAGTCVDKYEAVVEELKNRGKRA